ncbi:MAG: M20 family metallopeptidase [Gemmatimonadetes bacterium]|nr:M20 family metallopeptidase [Gemmatimonadota bacterium]
MKARVHQYIGEHREELLGSLQTLVRVDTTNPPGRNYRAMTDALLERCQGLGLQAKVHRVPDQEVRRVLGSDEFPRYNLIARWDAGRSQTVHFNAHYDVVPCAGQWKFGDPFEPGLAGDALYGRGSGDMKGAIAALLMAVEALKETGAEPAFNIECSFTADEETGGQLGAGWIVNKGLVNADFAVVCEGAAGTQVGCGHNGVLWLEVELTGKAAHASSPEQGVNAFEAMASVVQKLQAYKRKLNAPQRCYEDFDGRSRNPTLNIGGTFSGGEGDKVNTVPAYARFSLDRRLVPGEQLATVERELRRAVERAADPPCRVAAPLRIEPCVVDAEHALPRAFAQAVQAVRRRTASYRLSSGFTDLHYFAIDGGLPGIGYGVKGERAHGVDERVRVRDLALTARTYAEFMLRGLAST